MNNLTQVMQDRLDKWRKNTLSVPSAEKVKVPNSTGRAGGKRDFGDVCSLDELEEEARKSQTRK